jgi:hypothetical protein
MVTNQKEKQGETEQMMYGAWQGKDERDENSVFEYSLQINEKETHFVVQMNGETVTDERFATTGLHWMTDKYLYYIDTHRYFIERANKDEIVFGVLKTLGDFDGNYEFYLRLDRAA